MLEALIYLGMGILTGAGTLQITKVVAAKDR